MHSKTLWVRNAVQQNEHFREGLTHCDCEGKIEGKACGNKNPRVVAVINYLIKAQLLSPPQLPACKEWPGLLQHSWAEVSFAAASPATSVGPCAAYEVRGQESDILQKILAPRGLSPEHCNLPQTLRESWNLKLITLTPTETDSLRLYT